MSKQRIVTSGLGDFVRRILGKPSKPAGVATPEQADEVLQLLIKTMKRQLEVSGKAKGDNQQLCKMMIAELVLPKVINAPPINPDEKREVVNGDLAQDWAFACAEVLGFLAGLSLQDDAIDDAITQTVKVSKTIAHATSYAMKIAIGPVITGVAPPKPSKPSSSSRATKASEPMLTQKRKMVADMESEALSEDAKGNMAAAAALREMARIWNKEIELEEELNKVGKSAA